MFFSIIISHPIKKLQDIIPFLSSQVGLGSKTGSKFRGTGYLKMPAFWFFLYLHSHFNLNKKIKCRNRKNLRPVCVQRTWCTSACTEDSLFVPVPVLPISFNGKWINPAWKDSNVTRMTDEIHDVSASYCIGSLCTHSLVHFN